MVRAKSTGQACHLNEWFQVKADGLGWEVHANVALDRLTEAVR